MEQAKQKVALTLLWDKEGRHEFFMLINGMFFTEKKINKIVYYDTLGVTKKEYIR